MRFTRSNMIFMTAVAVLFALSSAHSKESGVEDNIEATEPLEISIIELETSDDASEPICVPKNILRMPPMYPEKCLKVRGKEHFVKLQFDVNGKGAPTHIETIDQSNNCFAPTARLAVRKWRYSCEYFGRKDVETVLYFSLK